MVRSLCFLYRKQRRQHNHVENDCRDQNERACPHVFPDIPQNTPVNRDVHRDIEKRAERGNGRLDRQVARNGRGNEHVDDEAKPDGDDDCPAYVLVGGGFAAAVGDRCKSLEGEYRQCNCAQKTVASNSPDEVDMPWMENRITTSRPLRAAKFHRSLPTP